MDKVEKLISEIVQLVLKKELRFVWGGCKDLSVIVTPCMMGGIVQQNWTHFTQDLIQSTTSYR